MSYLDDLFKKLNEAELDEKLTTKRAAKKQKLRAKRRAEKKAEKKAEVQDSKPKESTSLVVYDPKKLEQKDFTNEFKQLKDLLIQYLEAYWQEYNNLDQEFKSAGQSNPQLHEKYVACLTKLQNSITEFTEKEYPKFVNAITDLEYEQLNSFLNTVMEYIKAQTKANNLLACSEDTIEKITGQDAEQAIDDAQAILSLEDKSKSKTSKTKDVPTIKIIAYTDWKKQTVKLDDGFSQLAKTAKETFNAFGNFVTNTAINVWNGLLAIFNTPIAKDFLKTFMYANPFTAMLFDGKFGKLPDLKIPKKDKKDVKRDKHNIPQDIDKLNLEEIKKEFYGNKTLINVINDLYNSELTSINEKAKLKKLCENINDGFERKIEERTIRKNFSDLLHLVNKLGDEFNWDFKNIIGTTNKQEKQIDKKLTNRQTLKQESFKEFIIRINNTLNEAIQ